MQEDAQVLLCIETSTEDAKLGTTPNLCGHLGERALCCLHERSDIGGVLA